MKMKKCLAVLLALTLCALPLSGCKKGDSGEKDGLTDITVVLDWVPNTNHTGMYVALEKGYYEEAGLKVRIQQPPEDGALSLLAGGKAQFAVSVQEQIAAALASDSPLPVTAVASIIDHNTSGIISLKETGIRSPKDLEGKRYAAWDSPFEKATLTDIMSADGGDYDKVKMIPNSATDLITALNTDIDAAWIFYAWDGVACKVKGMDFDYMNMKDLNPVFDEYTPLLASSNAFLQEHPDQARAFLAATAKGYQYAMENPEDAAKILVKHAPEIDEAIAVESQKWLADQYQGDKPHWGTFDPERWGNFFKWMEEKGLVDRDISTEGFTNDYLPAQ